MLDVGRAAGTVKVHSEVVVGLHDEFSLVAYGGTGDAGRVLFGDVHGKGVVLLFGFIVSF